MTAISDLKVYTVEDVMQIFHVTRRTLYNYIKAGQLKAFKMGREWRFTEEALQDFINHGVEKNYMEKLK